MPGWGVHNNAQGPLKQSLCWKWTDLAAVYGTVIGHAVYVIADDLARRLCQWVGRSSLMPVHSSVMVVECEERESIGCHGLLV